MKTKIYLIILCLCLFGFTNAHAQSFSRCVYATSGDFYSNPNASLNWTIGEGISETFTNATNILTQGFQQSDDMIYNIHENGPDFQFSVYPNPCRNQVNITTSTKDKIEIVIRLYDVTGRLIRSIIGSTIATPYIVDLNSYSSTCYFLTINNTAEKLLFSKIIIKY